MSEVTKEPDPPPKKNGTPKKDGPPGPPRIDYTSNEDSSSTEPPCVTLSSGQSSNNESSPEVQYLKTPRFSTIAAKSKTDDDKKYITIELIKDANEPHFSLNDNELGSLVYKKLRIDPKKFFRYDESYTGKIRLLVSKDLVLDDDVKKISFMIRKGLKTRPINEIGCLDVSAEGGTWIRMFWIHPETRSNTIKMELETFGEVVGDIKFTTYRMKDDMSQEARLLAANNVERGDTRTFRMKLRRPLPRYGWIGGTKVKIMHEGQKPTCIRCPHETKGEPTMRVCCTHF